MTTHDDTAVPAGQMEPIRHDNLLINFTTEFLRIWDTHGSRAKKAAIWRPTPAADVLPGYFPLGDVLIDNHDNITGRHIVAVVCEADTPSADPAKGKALCRPVDYELIWEDTGSGSKKDGAIWRPVPPEGYVALGSVCSDGHQKPSFNAVRCVRADLVIASGLSEQTWNDRSSGARKSISTWSAIPPSAPADEIYLVPGTFVGCSGYSRPDNLFAYSLRIRISLEVNPAPTLPVLDSEIPPCAQVPEHPTQTARLPWFAVKDPQLSRREQLRESPFYLLQRTDYYQLVGHCKNGQDDARPIRWTAPRAQRSENLRTFTQLTSIEFGAQWQSNARQPFLFSARLNNAFTQCEIQSNEWLNPAPIEVAAVMAKNSSIGVYLMQSDYVLLRADGTHVTDDVSYTDGNSLHISQYTPTEPEVMVVPLVEPAVQAIIHTPSADNEVTAPLPEPEPDLPNATDTLP
nr:Vps62-related protein [uncultured Pseudomonas sp.]